MKKRLPFFFAFLFLLLSITAIAQVPGRIGWWKFDDPNNMLKAEVGSPLELNGAQRSVDGPATGNLATEIGVGSFLTMNHGIAPNGGGTTVNEYTLQIDFSVPETSIWHTFFQTDLTNVSDGDLFTNTSNSIGVSEAGYSSRTITSNTWYRMIVSVKNGEFFKIYVDGSLWLDGSGRDIDGRYGLLNSLLLFADNDGDDGLIQCSEAAIWDVALTADDALSLGGANGQYVQQRTKQGWWKFDDPTNLLKAEIGNPLALVGTQESVDGPAVDNKATKLGVGSYLKMTSGIAANGGGTKVNQYSMQIDFEVPETTSLHALLQTDKTNATDAELFINTAGNIGSTATTYTTDDIQANNWYRMVLSVKNGEFFRVYINGDLWLDAPGQAIDGNYALDNVLLLFANKNNQSGSILCSELSIWEVPLTDAEVADIGASPAVQVPARVGWWKFDDQIDFLKADIGYDLTETGISYSVSGPATGNRAVEVILGNYLTMTHGIYGNGGGNMVNDYSLQLDFSVPVAGIWHAFFQTDPTNTSDADLFTNTSNHIGTAATSYSANSIVQGQWYRMVVTVRNGEFFRVYMDGVLWLEGAVQPVDGRFALDNTLLLFADNDGDDGMIDCSEAGIWDTALTPDQVAKLGDVTTVVTGIAPKQISDNTTDLGQNYPNPFISTTKFPYHVAKTGNVTFRILDLTGKEIQVIDKGTKAPGEFNLDISSQKLNNGIYFLQMKTDQSTITRKMIVTK